MRALLNALRPLPTASGGTAIVLATARPPSAIAPLSTGDIVVADSTVRIAVFAGTSVAERLGGSCAELVPANRGALRVTSLTGGRVASRPR